MRRRLAAVLLGTIALAATGVGVYRATAPAPGPAVEAESEIAVTGCRPGLATDVTVSVRNGSPAPVRILGLVYC